MPFLIWENTVMYFEDLKIEKGILRVRDEWSLWLMPVMLGTQEAEIRSFAFWGQLSKKFTGPHLYQ
jgi:hypothetical protein